MKTKKKGLGEFLKKHKGSYSLFGQLIHCEPKDEPAVEAALKTRINSIVAKGEPLFTWMDQKSLSADFLIGKPSQFEAVLGGRPLADVVKAQPGIKDLLQGITIVDSIDEQCLETLKKTPFAVVVSGDGKRAVENLGNALRVRSFGSDGESRTVIARNNLIEQLRQETDAHKSEIEQRRKALATIKKDQAETLSAKENLQKELLQEQIQLASLNAALKTKGDHLNSGDSRAKVLEKRKQALSKERVGMLEREERSTSGFDELKEIVEEKETIVGEMEGEVNNLRKEYNKFLIKEVESRNFESRLKSLKQQTRDIEIQMERDSERVRENDDIIAKYNESLERAETMLEELQDQNATFASTLKEKDLALRSIKRYPLPTSYLHPEKRGRNQKNLPAYQ